MSTTHTRRLCFYLATACALFGPLAAGAQDASRSDLPHIGLDKGEAWALLIGVEKYTLAPPLRYTVNDVEQLSQTLIERGGLSADRVLKITDAESEPERRLMKHSDSGENFRVVDRRRLQSALKQQQMTVSKLGSSEDLAQLSKHTGGMPIIALGTLRNRLGRVVNLKCQLVETEGDALAGTAGGTAWLSESEWAMLGHSVNVRPDDRRQPLPGSEKPGETQTDRFISKLDEHADAPHPMLDPKFAYPVRIRVDGKIRHPVFRGSEMFLPVTAGETFAIEVENRSNRIVLMRLLVDGLNTLPQKADVKGVMTYEVAKRVNLDDARAWILDPAKAKRYGIRGFVTETGVGGKLRKFLVVDAEKSLAARKQFTDQIGLITAAFYASSGARSLGVDLGNQRQEDIIERTGQSIGNLLAVVHIRYVDAETLADRQ